MVWYNYMVGVCQGESLFPMFLIEIEKGLSGIDIDIFRVFMVFLR